MQASSDHHIIWAGLAIPSADEPPRADFAVCVQGHHIVATGPRAEVAARYPDADWTGGPGFLLLPGFVNSHDHGRAVGSASLGVADDLLELWLPMLGAQPAISPYLAAVYEGIQLLRAGVTATAHSHNPRAWDNLHAESIETLRGYRHVGVRVAFHPPIIDQHTLVYGDPAPFIASLPTILRPAARRMAAPIPLHQGDYLDLCAELFERYHDAHTHAVHIQVSPAGGQWCSDGLTLACADFARQHSTRVQMHMLETRYQARYAQRTWGHSFIRHLDEIGVLGADLTLAHMVYADESDFDLLAAQRVGVAHNPSSNLRLRSGIAPLAQMQRAGVRLGIGLDGHALDDDQDYLREMRLAWTLANRPGFDTPPVAARDLWRMGTTGGAAITFGDDVPLGKLAEGFLADCVLVDWEAVRGAFAPPDHPAHDYMLDFALRRATRSHVRHVMVNGAWRLRDGQIAGVDEAGIAAAIRDEIARQPAEERSGLSAERRRLLPYLRQFYASWDVSQDDRA